MPNIAESSLYFLLGFALLGFLMLLRWGLKYRNCCEELKDKNEYLKSELSATALVLAHVLEYPDSHPISFGGVRINPDEMEIQLDFIFEDIVVGVDVWQGTHEVFMGLKPSNAAYPHVANLGIDRPSPTPFNESLSMQYAVNLYAPTCSHGDDVKVSTENLQQLRAQGIDPVRL